MATTPRNVGDGAASGVTGKGYAPAGAHRPLLLKVGSQRRGSAKVDMADVTASQLGFNVREHPQRQRQRTRYGDLACTHQWNVDQAKLASRVGGKVSGQIGSCREEDRNQIFVSHAIAFHYLGDQLSGPVQHLGLLVSSHLNRPAYRPNRHSRDSSGLVQSSSWRYSWPSSSAVSSRRVPERWSPSFIGPIATRTSLFTG